LRRLEKELFATFAEPQDIRPGPDLIGCSYLRACIDEALRLSPPIPGLLPRKVLQSGILIDGNFIPEGTIIGSAAYSIHHNAKYFPKPFQYIPERWIPGAASWVTKGSVDLAQSAFVPFSMGPRNCIGRGLAYNGLLTALARTVYTFEMRLQAGSTLGDVPDSSLEAIHRKGEFHLQDIFTSGKDGPMVEFRRRRK
jgi:cytochrome P450